MADGIKFVPLDCQLDEKFDYIEAEFGLVGFAVVVKLFQRIYGGHGYYCEWNDRVALLFAHKIGVGCDVVREIVAASLRECIFDEGMFKKFGVLTSHGVQKRFLDVAKRRKQIFDKPEYALLCCENFSDDVDISGGNVCNDAPNACNQTTSKVKRSKVNVSEVSEVKQTQAQDAPALRTALTQKYGENSVMEYERRFDEWKAKRSNIRADRYSTIAKWLEQDVVVKPHESSFSIDDVMEELRAQYGGNINHE